MRKSSKIRLATLALAGLGVVASGVASAEMSVMSTGGLKVYHPDNGDHWFRIGGRMYLDQTFVDASGSEDQDYTSGAKLSKARLAFAGGLGADWMYKMVLDFPGGTVKSALIGYEGFDNVFASFGLFSPPQGMANWTDGGNLPFITTPAVVGTLGAPQDGIGLYVETAGEMMTFAASATQNHTDSSDYAGEVSSAGSDNVTYAARFTFSPLHTAEQTLHFGLSMNYRGLHENHNSIEYSAGPGFNAPHTLSLTTAIPVDHASKVVGMGAELAGIWGPFSMQAEYMRLHADGKASLADYEYSGYYVNASWVVTGESKNYDFASGTFGRVDPMSKSGAWEVLAQYDYIGLKDHNVGSGHQHVTTVGATWWVNSNLRVMANWVHSNIQKATPIDLNAAMLRVSMSW